MGQIPAGESSIDGLDELREGVRTAAAKMRPGRGQKISPRPWTSSTRIDNHVRATPATSPTPLACRRPEITEAGHWPHG